MKRTKVIITVICSMVLAITMLTPISASAAGEEGTPLPSLVDTSTYEISNYHHGWCVTYSNYYMLLRKHVALGSGQWDTITPQELRERTKLAHSYTYSNDGVTYSVQSEKKTLGKMSTSQRAEFLKDLLTEHPEGVVIYGAHSQKDRDAHAVLLTSYDYTNNTFYVLDPVRNKRGHAAGIERISTSTIGSLDRITVYMYIKSITGEVQTQMIASKKKSPLLASEFNYPALLVKGESYSLKGKITSLNKIEKVTVEILNDEGKVLVSKDVKPNSNEYELEKIDKQIKFGKLDEGAYLYRITASDSKSSAKVLEKKFTVVKKSTMEIKDGNIPSNMKEGTTVSVKGVINSNYKLKKVIIGVYNENGEEVATAKSTVVNAKSYYLHRLGSKISFEDLAKGNYSYKVVAKNQKTKEELVNEKFSVK